MMPFRAMRRAAAIFFLFIFLFNVAGRKGIFLILSQNAYLSMAQKTDTGNYRKKETILIKVPLSLSCSTDDGDYRRVQESFQHHGQSYRLVKQKVQHDTLFVICIKDFYTKNIFDLMSDIVKASSHRSGSASTMKLLHARFIKKYQCTPSIQLISQSAYIHKQLFNELHLCSNPPIIIIPSPPPQAAFLA